MDIEKQFAAGRGKAKAPAKRRSPGASVLGQSTSGSNTPHHQDTAIHINDDGPIPVANPTRRLILQSLSQGVSDHAPEERAASNKRETITSHHFPNARINESTADVEEQIANEKQADSNYNNLRAFRRADAPVDYDPDSVDELAMDVPQSSVAPAKRQSSPSKTSQSVNSAARRRATNKKGTKDWPLIYARSHEFDSHETSKGVDDDHYIYLKPGQDPKTWRLVAFDSTTEVFETKATIEPKDVVKVMADDDGRIRLEGPRGSDGNQSIFDMEFVDIKGFREFRDTHAPLLLGRQNVMQREEKIMKMLFGKPLLKNNKVGTSPLAHNSPSMANDHEAKTDRVRDATLWTRLKDGAQALNPITSTMSNRESISAPAPRGLSSRVVRSTRASAPTHDVTDDHSGGEVEKYSVLKGLGKTWMKPLTYGEGRQKATVYFDDLWRLDEEEFMNDSLIDFYMIYLFKQSGIPQDKVFFFNTYFFTRLTHNTGRGSMNYKAVERWTSKVDIFSYDYIVVPINEDTHWYLAIICNIANIDRKAFQEDFDHGVAGHVADDGNVTIQKADSAATETPAEPQLVERPTPVISRASSVAKGEDDVNLFDEESKLDLINREDTGTGDEDRQAGTCSSCVPQSPQSDAAHVVQSIFDEQIAPKTVLSNLNASPEKKKHKRRSMAPKKDPTQPVIIILDSLSQTRSPTVRALKDWLAAEGKAKRGMEVTIKENGFYPKSNQIPTQSNFTDCGVYLLGYAEKFFQDPDEFKNKLLTGEMTAVEDWPQLKPKEMRKNLRDIIFELAKEQKLTEVPKKKVKKSTQASKSSPARADAEPTKSIDPPPQTTSGTLKSVETKTAPTGSSTVSSSLDPVTLEETRPSELSVPRLRSPFSPKLEVKKSVHSIAASEASGKTPDIAPTLVSPDKAVVSSPPSKHTPGRWTHPEVRIPVKTPPSQQSNKDKVKLETSKQGLPQQERADTRSASPLKRVRGLTDDDELPKPPKKKSTPDIISVEAKGASRLSPLFTRPQEGHSDHPIEILDSQESKPTATQSPQRALGLPANQKQPSKSTHQTSTLRHEPSVEEISAFAMQRKQRRAKEDFVGRQLEARLDVDDEAREHSKHAKNSPSLGESEPDMMDVDSQGADPMDTADDGVVRETPEPGRKSPLADVTWMPGRSLPL
jgi:sentrin-specific protease 7